MKVLIVDDEMIIRQGISTVIDWSGEGFELLPPAESAEEALKRLGEERPDIVFTDIRMNGKSGLELAKETKTAYPETQVVILSGYDEFQYAQQALRDGVSDYLLKTSRPEDILGAAKRMRQVILDNKNRRGGDRLLEKVLLTKQGLSPEEREALAQRYPSLAAWAAKGNPMRVLLVSASAPSAPAAPASAPSAPAQSAPATPVSAPAQSAASSAFAQSASAPSAPERAGVGRSDMRSDMSSDIRAALEQAFGNAIAEDAQQWALVIPALPGTEPPESKLAALELKLRLRLHAAAGLPVRELEALSGSRNEAAAAMKFGWILDMPRYIAYEHIQNRQGIQVFCSQREEHELIAVLKSGNFAEVKRWAEELVERLRREPEATPVSLENFLQSLVIAGYRWLERVAASVGKTGQLASIGQDGEPEGQNHSFSVHIWLERLRGLMQAYAELSSNKTSYVQKAVVHIREHLADSLSLNEIAGQVHVHPNYLSEMFKRETGQTFSEFVVRERMEKAMSILRETPAKIGEVAHQVGYSDLKYFKQLFKKHTGHTPSGYRDNS